jgi:hypothetical protein
MFSKWIMGIVGISAIAILVDIIVKKGETEKYIKGVFGLFTLFVIVTPLPELFDNGLSIKNIFNLSSSEVIADDNYVKFVFDRRYDLIEDQLERGVKEKCGVECDANIYFVESCPEKIDVVYLYLKKSGIPSEDENKHIIVEIENFVKNRFDVDSKKVVISWEKTST